MNLAGQLEAIATLRRQMHVKQHDEPHRYYSMEELVLAHGRRFTGAVANSPVPRQCFHRAYRHAIRVGSRWTYYEGVAIRPPLPLPIHHAWVARIDYPDVAVDLAWDKPEDCMYIGIPFKPEYVRDCFYASRRKWYGVILAHWLNFPLLTGKTRVEDVIIL